MLICRRLSMILYNPCFIYNKTVSETLFPEKCISQKKISLCQEGGMGTLLNIHVLKLCTWLTPPITITILKCCCKPVQWYMALKLHYANPIHKMKSKCHSRLWWRCWPQVMPRQGNRFWLTTAKLYLYLVLPSYKNIWHNFDLNENKKYWKFNLI